MVTKTNNWKRFYFESNYFFGYTSNIDDWQRLRLAYPELTDDQLLDAREATYKGNRTKEERDANPNYGFRREHDGERTLRDFFAANGMSLFPPLLSFKTVKENTNPTFCPVCGNKMSEVTITLGPYIGGPMFRESKSFVCKTCNL